MKKLEIKLKNSKYPICIDKGLLDVIGITLLAHAKPCRTAIITDSNVDMLYGDRVRKSLRDSGFDAGSIVLTPGEGSKSIEQLADIYDRLLDLGITRKDFIVALGGGVVGDIAGFAAATYMRGIGFIQIPTTLLAQIDSSIGGKVGVNLSRGKNLAGAFYHPAFVLADTDCLVTLRPEVLADGVSEAIKYGAIRDAGLFDMIDKAGTAENLLGQIDEIIYRCCSIKKDIVQRDERESGERMLLNFGHTLAHAIEKTAGFGVFSHGDAVAIGMYAITANSEFAGDTKPGTAARIKDVLKKYNLPTRAEGIDQDELVKAAAFDKKSTGNSINLILLRSIGDSFIKTLPTSESVKYLQIPAETGEG